MAKRQPPHTGGSQFFLVWDDTPLPPEYTVFGTIDEAGLDVISGIAAQGVDPAGRQVADRGGCHHPRSPSKSLPEIPRGARNTCFRDEWRILWPARPLRPM
ncbi:MAG: peptidylprolyl isomerase [Tessaracoccus sp.]